MRPRDSRGRYTKISSNKFHIFWDKTPSSSRNPWERYTSNQKEENNARDILGQQVGETIKSNPARMETESIQTELLAVPESSRSVKISHIMEDPNLADIVDVEKIIALFVTTSYSIVSQLESTLSPPEKTIGNTFLQTRPIV